MALQRANTRNSKSFLLVVTFRRIEAVSWGEPRRKANWFTFPTYLQIRNILGVKLKKWRVPGRTWRSHSCEREMWWG